MDNTNFITVANLREAFARDAKKVKDKDIEMMIAEVDLKENDMIDFGEFLRLMNDENDIDLFKN